MRDLALLAIVLGAIPYILKRPLYGLLLWVVFSIMNPHRLAYGFAYDFSFAMLIALVTLTSLALHTKQNYPFPTNGLTIFLLLFIPWMCVSPLFSFHPEGEWWPWSRAIKVQIMVLVTFFVVNKRTELNQLAWALALSIGFFGIKGGLFTLINGGGNLVFGPDGSFIGDNNALALAVIMAVPIFRYLQLHSQNAWVRRGCVVVMLLCVASSVGSHSRGALLALAGMAAFLWLKSPNKIVLGVIGLAIGIIIFMNMPESWLTRMNTINTYEQDASAMGRINAWWMAWNLAVYRFPIGGGFEVYTPYIFSRFAPVGDDIHAAHSIYFQVLGEHGFVGLFLFLGIFFVAWRSGSWIIAKAKRRPELRWAQDLAAMLQVSLVGYAVGGAFLSLSYYDFPYYVASMLAITRLVVHREIEALSQATSKSDIRAPDPTPALPALSGKRPDPLPWNSRPNYPGKKTA